jgi:hypothetical protein
MSRGAWLGKILETATHTLFKKWKRNAALLQTPHAHRSSGGFARVALALLGRAHIRVERLGGALCALWCAVLKTKSLTMAVAAKSEKNLGVHLLCEQ